MPEIKRNETEGVFVRTHFFGVTNLHFSFSLTAQICCLSDAAGLKAPVSLGGNNYTLGLQLASFSWTGRVFPQLDLPWEKFSTLQLLLARLWCGKNGMRVQVLGVLRGTSVHTGLRILVPSARQGNSGPALWLCYHNFSCFDFISDCTRKITGLSQPVILFPAGQ